MKPYNLEEEWESLVFPRNDRVETKSGFKAYGENSNNRTVFVEEPSGDIHEFACDLIFNDRSDLSKGGEWRVPLVPSIQLANLDDQSKGQSLQFVNGLIEALLKEPGVVVKFAKPEEFGFI